MIARTLLSKPFKSHTVVLSLPVNGDRMRLDQIAMRLVNVRPIRLS